MWDIVAWKIKKYLFLISILFLLIAGPHLLYLYMYDDAEEIPVEWGTISEAIIWAFPNLNPLVPATGYNKYINSILYRSIMTYNINDNKIESDLASCDISNLSLIECYLENNIKWSNGEPITEDDIIATLNLIEKTDVNPWISTLLENTTIEKWNGKITFNNSKKDINFLEVFFQPIVPKSVIDSLWEKELEGSFPPVGWVYSGKYTLTNVSQDETVGITKMTLTKNPEYFANDTFIETILFKIFRDNAHFIKHKNSVNIFNDRENIIGSSIPRLQSNPYSLPQFVAVFLNTETVTSESVRRYLLGNMSRDTIVSDLGEGMAIPSFNPFLSDISIDEDPDLDLWKYLKEQGYFTKEELLQKDETITQAQEEEVVEETISQEAQIQEPQDKKVQEDLTYITSPTNKKYNFVSEDNILIKWNVPAGVEKVFIGDYQLQWFSAGDDSFYYRLLESYDTIAQWENIYKVFFEKEWEKELADEFEYVYYTDTEKLSEVQNNFFAEAPASQTSNEEVAIEWELWIDTGSLLNLDDRFYYTIDGDAFKIKLIYVNSDVKIQKSAEDIKKQIEEKWVFVELIWLSLADITRGLRDDSLVYDGILIGLNLGYFDSNVFPYFHSSQVKNGYNFANYKELGLDILLEELKSNTLTETKRDELKEKILEIIKDASITKTFYTPEIHLLVDQNLQWFELPERIPDEVHRFDPLTQTYMTKKKRLSTESKSFWGFWKFLINSLF